MLQEISFPEAKYPIRLGTNAPRSYAIALQCLAKARGVSVAALIREAIAEKVGAVDGEGR
jgi:hypothetical protein